MKKLETQKKEISKVFNHMLRILNDQEEIKPYKYGQSKKLLLENYMKRERGNWSRKKDLLLAPANKDDENQEDD